MVSIEGKIAVVTGAGRGIGRAIALEFSRMGAKVALAARSASELEESARAAGSTATIIPTDVRRKDDVQKLFENVASTLGPPDILVNAAGIGVFGRVIDFSDSDYDAILDTNLRSIFMTCRQVLPSMIARGSGDIVNIASIAGKVGSATRAVYCASKFGVVGFTQSLAEEVRQHGIRVSVVCPGSTDTTFSSDPHREGKARGKMLSPGDVAYAVRTLVTQEPNSFISEIILRPTQKP
ncbi:MAG TPA: SDR family oxidoreductase [Terriglobia bacterium]|nr:SDR family oxidoreductase [Terriglobia bacterium]